MRQRGRFGQCDSSTTRQHRGNSRFGTRSGQRNRLCNRSILARIASQSPLARSYEPAPKLQQSVRSQNRGTARAIFAHPRSHFIPQRAENRASQRQAHPNSPPKDANLIGKYLSKYLQARDKPSFRPTRRCRLRAANGNVLPHRPRLLTSPRRPKSPNSRRAFPLASRSLPNSCLLKPAIPIGRAQRRKYPAHQKGARCHLE